MLDVTVSANQFRPCPEDPSTPVLSRKSGENTYAAGGAANLAVNLDAQGCDVVLCAPWAESSWNSARLRKLVCGPPETGVKWPSYTPSGDPWLRAPGTTTKTRYVQGDRLVARHDEDYDSDPVFPPACVVGPKPSAVVLTDYGRGAITRESAADWSQFCRRFQIPMYADPKKGRLDLWNQAIRLEALVLNWDEAVEFAGKTHVDSRYASQMAEDGTAAKIAELISIDTQFSPRAEFAVVKRGKYGSTLVTQAHEKDDVDGCGQIIHVQAIHPSDSTAGRQGAGDTYLAALVAARARGLEMALACSVGSAAAGVAVSRPGTSVVALREALEALKGKVAFDTPARILRQMGYIVGYTNGCFDFHLHQGHLSTIRHAASLCDFLFVGVDSDKRVAKLKGANRPVVPAADRIAQLSELRGVFRAFQFDDHEEALRSVSPSVLVKGADYQEKGVPEAELLKEWGGRLEFAPKVDVPHTTERLRAVGL